MFSSTRVPLFTLLASLVAGLAVRLSLPWILICAAGGFFLFFLHYRRQHAHNPGLWLLACCLGMLRGHLHFDSFPPDDIRYLSHTPGEIVRMRATVCSDAFSETAFLQSPDEEGATRRTAQFKARVQALLTPAGERTLSGIVSIHVEQFPGVRYGDTIELLGKLYDTRGATNPGQFDFAAFLARQRIHKTLSVPEAALIRKTASRMSVARALAITREKLLMALRAQLPPDDYALYSTVLLGSRSAMSSETRGAFVLSGTIQTIYYQTTSNFLEIHC